MDVAAHIDDGQHFMNQVVVELSYSGVDVPDELFAELGRLGWRVPPTPPRPASAIDWSTPDPVAGTNHTIRDWRVDGARLDPPQGSGANGRWTDDDRVRLVRAVCEVLLRHGIVPGGEAAVTDLPAVSAAEVPTAPATPRPVVTGSAALAEVIGVLTVDRAKVFGGLVESMGSVVEMHPAIVADGVGAGPGSEGRTRVRWLEAAVDPAALGSQAGTALLSSSLFRRAVWCRRPGPEGRGAEAAGEGEPALRAIVPVESAEAVAAAVNALAGARLALTPLDANGRRDDALAEGRLERVLFDVVCSEIVRIAPEAVCRAVD